MRIVAFQGGSKREVLLAGSSLQNLSYVIASGCFRFFLTKYAAFSLSVRLSRLKMCSFFDQVERRVQSLQMYLTGVVAAAEVLDKITLTCDQ